MLADLDTNEPWYYPLFLLWLSTGLRNAEIRGLTWDCIRWQEREVLVCKSLRRDGYSSGQVVWAPTKTGRERVVPLTAQVLETLQQHKAEMEQLGIYDPYGLVFVTPTSHTNIYDHLVGRDEPDYRRISSYLGKQTNLELIALDPFNSDLSTRKK